MRFRRGEQALLPGRWRSAAGVLAGLSAVCVGLLTWHYHGRHGPGRLDLSIYHELVGLDRHEPVLWRISLLGSPAMLVIGTLVLAVLAARTRRGPGIGLAVLGPAAAVVLTELVLKPATGRLLDGDLSMPSGHTTSIGALASVAVVLFVVGRPGSPRPARITLAVLAAASVAVVVVSVVATYRHYASDALSGVLVAVGVVALLALLLDWLAVRNAGGARQARASVVTARENDDRKKR